MARPCWRWWRCRWRHRPGWRTARCASRSSTHWPTSDSGGENAMTTRQLMQTFALVAACAAPYAHADDDVAALLKAADRYRTGQDNLQVETHVSVLNRDGTPDKERRYTVFVQAQHKSLV